MHKIHAKPFDIDDFSHDHMTSDTLAFMQTVVDELEKIRQKYMTEGKNKDDWYDMIQLLPSSYNQKRTVMLNYEVLAGIYKWRKNHKLDEWVEFCKWIETLPYSELITTCKDTPNIKTGEWLCVDAVDNGPSKYKCSACGTEYMDRIEHINYCGHCGAKMAKEPTKEDSNV